MRTLSPIVVAVRNTDSSIRAHPLDAELLALLASLKLGAIVLTFGADWPFSRTSDERQLPANLVSISLPGPKVPGGRIELPITDGTVINVRFTLAVKATKRIKAMHVLTFVAD